MQPERTRVFESMPVERAVLSQIAPAIASQLVALIYNLADTYFVGRLNDPRMTAAVTVAFPSFLMLTAFSNLFGVGGAAAVARALGKKRNEDAAGFSSVAFWLSLAFAAVFSALFLIFAKPILTLCGATAETLPCALGYARNAVAAGGVFTVLSTALANLVRSEGAAMTASIGVSLGGVLNIILDPFFILPRYMGLGAAGAGAATAISNAVSALFLLAYIVSRRDGTLSVDPKLLKHTRRYIGDILKSGAPSALQYALTVAAVAAQAHFVSKYPTEAVAALGIVKKLDNLPLYFSIGVSAGLLPLIAYNHAAGNVKRRRDAFVFGTAISFGFALLCLAAYEIFAPGLASIFIKDAKTVTFAASFLRRMVTAMPLMSVCYPLIIRFQAMGKTRESIACSVLRKGVLDIPLLIVMDRLLPLYGIMWVQPIVDGVSLAAALYLTKRASSPAKEEKIQNIS